MLRTKLLFAAAALATVAHGPDAAGQTRIIPNLPRGDSVTALSISPDSKWVAMEVNVTRHSQLQGNLTADYLPEVFLVGIDGASDRSVSLGWLPPQQGMFIDGTTEVFAPDSQNVAYFLGDRFDRAPRHLQVASVAGDTRFDVGAWTPDSLYLWTFRYVPRGDSAVDLLAWAQLGESTAFAPYGLFHVSLDEASFTELLPDVRLPYPDTSQLVTNAGQYDVLAVSLAVETNSVLGLVGTRFSDGEPTPLHPPLAQDEAHSPHLGNDWQVTSDGRHLIYRATQNTPGVNELFSISLETGVQTQLSIAADTQHDVGEIQLVGPENVLYTFERLEGPGQDHGYRSLYSVPIAGGQSQLLYQGDPSEGDGRVMQFWTTPDGSHAVIRERTHGSEQLLSVSMTGGTRETLLDGIAALDLVPESLQFTLDGRTAVFATERSRSVEWFAVPVAGGQVRSLSAALSQTLTPQDDAFYIHGETAKLPDDKQLLILTRNTDVPGSRDLWSLPLDGGSPIRINDNPTNLRVMEFDITPDGSTVVYLARADNNGVDEAFAIPLRLHWTGEVSDQWNEAGNWGSRPGEANQFVPLTATSVFIDQDSAQVTVPWQVGSLEIANLTIGTETDSASVVVAPRVPINIARELNIGPTSAMAVPSTSALEAHTIHNQGLLETIFSDERAGTRFRWRFSSFVNGPSAQVIVLDDQTLLLEGDVIHNDGSIDVGQNAELQLKGRYIGHGNVNGGHVKVAGILKPGGHEVAWLDIGDILTFENLTPRLSSQLEIGIGGTTSATQHDAIRATDQAHLDGLLRIFLLPDPENQNPSTEVFAPQVGDQFVIVSAEGGVTGRFADVDVPSANWGIRYEPTHVALVSLDPTNRGDFDASGVVDQADLDLLLLNWGDDQLPVAWINYLPVEAIGQAELDGVLLNWGREIDDGDAARMAFANVPEPASARLAIFLVVAACPLLLLRDCCRIRCYCKCCTSACVIATWFK